MQPMFDSFQQVIDLIFFAEAAVGHQDLQGLLYLDQKVVFDQQDTNSKMTVISIFLEGNKQ